MTIIEHLEKHLGKIDQGWKENAVDHELQVVSFKDSPGVTVTTYLTLGFSDCAMNLSDVKKVRQELVFSVYTLTNSELVVSFLLFLCELIIDRGKAVLRGEVIPLSKGISQKMGFDAVYCTIPVFFDDEFCTYNESLPSTVMVWILPIYQSEANYIEAHGWESFEDLLEDQDPDLCSLERNSVIR